MPVIPMKIDTTPMWKLVFAGAIATAAVITSVIIGAAGPSPDKTIAYSAYNCRDGSHVWDPAKCNGTQLGGPKNVTWKTVFGPLTTRNRMWWVAMGPYRRQDSPLPASDSLVPMELYVEISVYHRSDPHKGWEPMIMKEGHLVKFRCHSLKYQGRCRSIGAVFDQTVNHPFHQVVVLPISHDGRLGDVEFDVTIGTTSWTDLELGFNVTFLVLALVAFLALMFGLRRHPTFEWSFEQGCVLILQFFLIFYNNPFLALEFLIPGWFLLFLGSLLKTLFVSVLLLWWLLTVEKIHRPEGFRLLSLWQLPKVIVVVLFMLFATIAFTWSNIRDSVDPVFGQDDMIPGVVAFQALSGMVVCVIVVWLLVLTAMSLKNIATSTFQLTRAIFFGIPSAVVGASILLGSFIQGYGATLEILYFGTLYNVYILLLTFAVWPTVSPFRVVANPKLEAPEDEVPTDQSIRAVLTGEGGEESKELIS